MKTVLDVELSGKRVLVRVDFNVPLDEDGRITDDSRIRGALPTLEHVLKQRARLIVASHLGRPKGKEVQALSLSPVAERLAALLKKNVKMAPDCIGPQVERMVSDLKEGDVLLLENLRFHPGEEKDDEEFAKKLASLCDAYVNDAFAVCHRRNASVSAVTKYAPVSVAGLLLKKELDYFEKAMADPKRPLVAIVGGAKVSSKLGALENMLQRVNKIIIGGAMANTFLKSKGICMGKSRVEEDLVETAGSVLKKAAARGIRVYLPVDAVVAAGSDGAGPTTTVPVEEIPEDGVVMDIGPASVLLFSEALHDAGTIVWNGPMGVFEKDAFSRGTFGLARSVAGSQALTIVGGGDTDTALHESGEAGRITYISTGGGAFLALLEGKTLPAVEALQKSLKRPAGE